jgi:hypothetical protein
LILIFLGPHHDPINIIVVFIIYINDIPLNIHGIKLVLLADDTNILVVDKNEDDLQQKILYIMNELQIWFKKFS